MNKRLLLQIDGIVQGVGFRPFVYHLACQHNLTGWVANNNEGVIIQIQGQEPDLELFRQDLTNLAPPLSHIRSIHQQQIACQNEQDFRICESVEPDTQSHLPFIPPDTATCQQCLAELYNPTDRRFRYPFMNCTHCGPRYSIVTDLPYDRSRTSMHSFSLCPHCAKEYKDAENRRFHAEPVACPACGPALQLLDANGKVLATKDAALNAAAQAINDGLIIALKGLGGYQLVCAANNEQSVQMLRHRKRRPTKPFAVMFPSLSAVSTCCKMSNQAQELLTSPAAPIVLLPRRTAPQQCTIAANVAPANPYLGVMLPTTPLHHLLTEQLRYPIICTSGNVSDEPIVTDDQDALARLASIANLFLCHNRPVVRPIDDSLLRLAGRQTIMLRRARGYAPTPIQLDISLPRILAVGGHLKNTIALSINNTVLLSQHIGDLNTASARNVQTATVHDLMQFCRFTPQAIACDLHPDYASTHLAQQLAVQFGVPLLKVQHHHAHIAACLAENNLNTTDLTLGLAWDGSGYGPDGSVWGGEFLLCQPQAHNCERLASLYPFCLPGGEQAIRDPRRTAFAMLLAADAIKPGLLLQAQQRLGLSHSELRLLPQIANKPALSPTTTSMGRLFDAVSALLGLCHYNSYEGEAAMALEFAAQTAINMAHPAPPYDFELIMAAQEPKRYVDWRPMLANIVNDLNNGVEPASIAARFHYTCVAMALSVARKAGVHNVALSGGCFQNGLLVQLTQQTLDQNGYKVYTHMGVPPGDGGLALGQIIVAAGMYPAMKE